MKKDAVVKNSHLLAGSSLILMLFFFSGGCGLIFENLWTRMLRLVMGNTLWSATTVLFAFMGGLALGSYVGGRLIDRSLNGLRIYGLLEAGIGLYCLFLPALIHGIEPLYRYVYQNFQTVPYVFGLFRFLVCVLLLIIPASFMGATFPVLSKTFARQADRLGWTIGKLYAINSFGAVFGAFLSGFILIPNLGVRYSIFLACAVNFLIAGISLILSCRRIFDYDQTVLQAEGCKTTSPRGSSASGESLTSWVHRSLLVGYFLAGLASLVYEVAWMRVLCLIVGSSVYAFSLMLTAFILGLAIGSLLFARFFVDARRSLALLGVVEVGIGLSALAVVPLFGILPVHMVRLVLEYSRQFWVLQTIEFGMIFLLMLVPTLLMGGAFPLVNRLYASGTQTLGRSVGTVYAANTIGAVLGSSLAGFLLIPWLGIQSTLLAAVLVNMTIGTGFLVLAFRSAGLGRRILIPASCVAATVVLAAIVPAWDPAVMSSGAYLYAKDMRLSANESPAQIRDRMRGKKVVFYREDEHATVTVHQTSSGQLDLSVNGKCDASSHGDLSTQQLLAHAPLLLHPDPKDVFVIGLASGITLGSAATHPVRTLDCAEISSAMVEACRLFDRFNGKVLDDPRVRIHLTDGRNHLNLARERYDVIISEPSNPWIAGIADLFTQEFFDLCRARLNPGGLACIWLQSYDLDLEVFQSIVHTFASVFPHSLILESVPSADYLLIGSVSDIQLDYRNLATKFSQPLIARDLKRIDIRSPEDFLAYIVVHGPQLRQFAQGKRLHTDDNPFIEFHIPKKFFQTEPQLGLWEFLNASRSVDTDLLIRPGSGQKSDEDLHDRVAKLVQARKHAVQAMLLMERGQFDQARQEQKLALTMNPSGFFFLRETAENLTDQALNLRFRGKVEDALRRLQMSLDVYPRLPKTHLALGSMHAEMGDWSEALQCYQKVLSLDPRNIGGRNSLAWLLATCPDGRIRQPDRAVELADELCRASRYENPIFLRTLAAAHAARGQFSQAEETTQRAIRMAAAKKNHRLLKSLLNDQTLYADHKPYRVTQTALGHVGY